MLLVYNATNTAPGSQLVFNYYLPNRPMIAGANVLPDVNKLARLFPQEFEALEAAFGLNAPREEAPVVVAQAPKKPAKTKAKARA